MVRLLLCALSLFFICMPLTAANKKDDKKANHAWMEAGKPAAKAAFAKQAASAKKPGQIPLFIGEYLWGGRADDQYKPFHMFELRLQGAASPLSGVSYRVITLDYLRKPTTEGPWVSLGDLKAGEKRDLSYKLNGPTFPAFQIEVKWKGGEEHYLVWDKVPTIPLPLSDVANETFLIVLNQNYEVDKRKKAVNVTYTLWNVGGVTANEVKQTVLCRDKKNKTVATGEVIPNKGTVPANYAGEQKVTITKAPAFETVAVQTKTAAPSGGGVDPGKFTGAKDIEVAELTSQKNTLNAKVRNGLGSAVQGLVVTLTLTDKNGKAIKALDVSVGDMKADEIREISADITGVPAWGGYEVGWTSSSVPTAEPQQNKQAAQPQEIVVDGLAFTVTKSTSSANALEITGVLENRRNDPLKSLVVTIVLPRPKKTEVEVTLKPVDLEPKTSLNVNFTVEGVRELTGFTLKWVSVK